MAISSQTQPQEFSLYRNRKGKSDPEHGKWSKRQDQGGQNERTMQHRFVPPWPYRFGSGVNWFGNDRFLTLLRADVTWGRGEKTFWFRQEWGYYGPRPWDTVTWDCSPRAAQELQVSHLGRGRRPCASLRAPQLPAMHRSYRRRESARRPAKRQCQSGNIAATLWSRAGPITAGQGEHCQPSAAEAAGGPPGDQIDGRV